MSEPLLQVSNLAVGFRSGGRESIAVDGVSFSIAKGNT